MKVLLVRCDGLAGAMLALPAMTWLRAARPDWELHALVAPEAAAVVENDPAVDAFYGRDGADDRALADRLVRERYDAAVLLHYETALARLVRAARIPRRHGPLSGWSSWLLLNRGRRPGRRSEGRHERDVCLDLVKPLAGRSADAPAPAACVHLTDAQREAAAGFRRREADGASTVAFVQPGAGGTPLDWAPGHWAEVANALARRRGWRVFVTGSHHDRLMIDALAPDLDPTVAVLAERYPLRDFLGVLAAGDLMVAPDSGPLHLAAALDLAAVGVYPPLPAASVRRRGPLGRWTGALEPPVDCPARRNCLVEHCLLHNCLEGIQPSRIIELATDLVDRRRRDLATAGTVAP